MGVVLHWFLPTNGDSRTDLSLGNAVGAAGSHDEVAERIAEYYALGLDEFILSGYPHLEEAYQVGEGLIPILRRRGLMTDPH